MDHATVAAALLATPFAAALLPLTLRLLPVISRIGQLIVALPRRRTHALGLPPVRDPTPRPPSANSGGSSSSGPTTTSNPTTATSCPTTSASTATGIDVATRPPTARVATLFGTITLWRYLYQPIHGVERSIFPLEIRLGLAAGRATPALAERVARAAADSTQGTVLADLKRDHGVAWSVATLRAVIATTWEGMAPHLHAAQVAQVLAWLEQADASRGSRKPVLAAGRDGVFVPIRGDDSYREAATATLSVHDRAGQRLGTVYLGRMPEPGQGTLSEQLTRLITDVLAGWSGPLPRLAYVTDAGHHPTEYYERVLKPMRHPSRPGEPWSGSGSIDYYHASEYIHKLSAGVVPRPAAGPGVGAEDVPVAEVEAACDLPDLALGGGDPEPSDGVGSVEGVPGGVRLPAGPHQAPGLRELSPEPFADRQRGDGGGVQDGVQPTSEAFGDGVECGGWSADRGPSGHPIERRVVGSASIVLAIEEASRRANSGGIREEKPEKAA